MRIASLSFRYGRRAPWVLRDARLVLDPGDVVEVTGPNGAGKSTLLRLAAGLLRPVRGSVEDRPRIVGYAPERFPADQPFTVAAYLRHMTAVRRANTDAIGHWSERLGMDHLLGQRLPDLSKGSAHKVGLAQALLAEPGLLVLDEPFAGLDAATRAELPNIIDEVRARGGIVLLSDHQGDLRAFPGLRHCEVRDHVVREPEPAEKEAAEAAEETLTTLEVAVPASRAADLAARLRAEGCAVRVTAQQVPGQATGRIREEAG